MLRRYFRLIRQGLTDYKWFLFYLQRATLVPTYRQIVASKVAFFLPHTRHYQPSPQAKQVGQRLQEDGIHILPDLVTDSQIKDMVQYLGTRLCYDPRHPNLPGFRHPRDAHRACFHAYYTPQDTVHVPHLMDVANHPIVLDAVEYVLGCKPTISIINIWWLLASYDRSDPQAVYFQQNARTLHRDVDDWAQIKLFVYLTDVQEGSAPHVFLKASHDGRIGPDERTLPLATAKRSYPDRLITITGKAGTAWLENSFGLHQGSWPEMNNRLILTISYTLFPLPMQTAVRRPRESENNEVRFDSYINRSWLMRPGQP